MLHTWPRPMKSRQMIPKESSVFFSFVSDTSLGQHKFSVRIRICRHWHRTLRRVMSAYADNGSEWVKSNPFVNIWMHANIKVYWCRLQNSSYFLCFHKSCSNISLRMFSLNCSLTTSNFILIRWKACKKMKPIGFALSWPCDPWQGQGQQKQSKMVEVTGDYKNSMYNTTWLNSSV